jgi:hypothetical protein
MTIRIPNTLGQHPKAFEIDCLVGSDAIEIKWRDATTDGDHITLEGLYKSVEGEYHYADAAWAYIERRTGIDLFGILKELAAERSGRHG